MVAGTCLLAATVAPTAAAAQSFFQTLFGGGASPAPQARVITPASLGVWRGTQNHSAQGGRHDEDRQGRHGGSSGQGGGYRTVCVRLCDGYYWPISANVSRSRFYRDSRACQASCGAETKLYYQGSDAGDAKSLVDMQGRPYSRLDTAFLYRKSLVNGCACKAAPWSEAELERHERYAMAEGAMRPSAANVTVGEAVVIAGNGAPAKLPATLLAVVVNAPPSGQNAAADTIASAPTTAPVAPPKKPAPAVIVAAATPDKPAPAPAKAAVAIVGDPTPSAVQPVPVNVAKVPEKPMDAPAQAASAGLDSAQRAAAEPSAVEGRATAEPQAGPAVASGPATRFGGATRARLKAVHGSTPKRAPAVHQAQMKTRIAAKAPQPKSKPVQSASLLGGQQKLTWPGDAPTKFR